MTGHSAQQQVLVERLPSLLRDIYEGKLLLPEVPHERWDDERRLRLFERIFRGVPLGSVTVWRTSLRLGRRRDLNFVPLLDRGTGVSQDYLVDGLGGVVTLFEELGPAFWLGDKSRQRRPYILPDTAPPFVAFELQTQTFRLIQRSDSLRPTELALYDVFEAEAQHVLASKLRSLPGGEALANRMSRFVGIFFDFTLPVLTFVSEDAESARLILRSLQAQPPGPEQALKTSRWYCDVCEQVIRHPSEGWVEWLVRREGMQLFGKGLRLVHLRFASPRPQGCQYNSDEEFQRDGSTIADMGLDAFQGPDGLNHLLSLLSEHNLPKEQVIEMIKRLHIPGYERARFHAQAATAAGIIEPNLPLGFYWQDEIATVIEWADKQGRTP
jgi:hypothetical protein